MRFTKGRREFDIPFSMKLTRKKTNEVKELLKDKNHYKSVASSQRFDYLPQKSRKHDPTVFYMITKFDRQQPFYFVEIKGKYIEKRSET